MAWQLDEWDVPPTTDELENTPQSLKGAVVSDVWVG